MLGIWHILHYWFLKGKCYYLYIGYDIEVTRVDQVHIDSKGRSLPFQSSCPVHHSPAPWHKSWGYILWGKEGQRAKPCHRLGTWAGGDSHCRAHHGLIFPGMRGQSSPLLTPHTVASVAWLGQHHRLLKVHVLCSCMCCYVSDGCMCMLGLSTSTSCWICIFFLFHHAYTHTWKAVTTLCSGFVSGRPTRGLVVGKVVCPRTREIVWFLLVNVHHAHSSYKVWDTVMTTLYVVRFIRYNLGLYLLHINHLLSSQTSTLLSWQKCLLPLNAGLDLVSFSFILNLRLLVLTQAATSLKIVLHAISAIHHINKYFQDWSDPQIWKAWTLTFFQFIGEKYGTWAQFCLHLLGPDPGRPQPTETAQFPGD